MKKLKNFLEAWWHWCLGAAATVAIGVLVVWQHGVKELVGETGAAWAGSIGTVAAIVGAARIAARQHRENLEAETRREQGEARQQLAGLLPLVLEAHFIVSMALNSCLTSEETASNRLRNGLDEDRWNAVEEALFAVALHELRSVRVSTSLYFIRQNFKVIRHNFHVAQTKYLIKKVSWPLCVEGLEASRKNFNEVVERFRVAAREVGLNEADMGA